MVKNKTEDNYGLLKINRRNTKQNYKLIARVYR